MPSPLLRRFSTSPTCGLLFAGTLKAAAHSLAACQDSPTPFKLRPIASASNCRPCLGGNSALGQPSTKAATVLSCTSLPQPRSLTSQPAVLAPPERALLPTIARQPHLDNQRALASKHQAETLPSFASACARSCNQTVSLILSSLVSCSHLLSKNISF